MSAPLQSVWSFWTAPYLLRRGWHWGTDKHLLLSWILSFETARAHYPHTVLHTDRRGARLLNDGLGLPFTEVTTCLDELDEQDPDWWMLGKLRAYKQQRHPFVHLDHDVFLWKPLPPRVAAATVFAQHLEDAGANPVWYAVDFCETLIRTQGQGVVPLEWAWFRRSGRRQVAACCGILGSNDPDFIRGYATSAIDLLSHPRNRSAFDSHGDKTRHNPLFEQFYLCACAAFHGIEIEYLFDGYPTSDAAVEAGYTHLIGGSKTEPLVMEKLEALVARDYPHRYEQCLRIVRDGIGES
jgi:hypothetical protein